MPDRPDYRDYLATSPHPRRPSKAPMVLALTLLFTVIIAWSVT